MGKGGIKKKMTKQDLILDLYLSLEDRAEFLLPLWRRNQVTI